MDYNELMKFLQEVAESPTSFNKSVVFNRIKPLVGELTRKEYAWVLEKVVLDAGLRIQLTKFRGDSGDDLAAEEFDLVLNGDPLSRIESIQLGLIGEWRLNNTEIMGELLLRMGYITQKEFDLKTNPLTRDTGKEASQLLAELVAEVKTYPNEDSFMSAVYSESIKAVPSPIIANILSLVKGRYNSVGDFYNAAIRDEILEKKTPAEPVKPKETPAEPVKAIQSVDDVKKEIEDKIAEKTSQASLFEFSDKKKAYITK